MFVTVLIIRDGGDIRLFIKLVPKLKVHLVNNVGDFNRILIGWFIKCPKVSNNTNLGKR